MSRITALSWYGGKSALSNNQTGAWISSILPQRTNVLYCEPFAGMLGVLLQRPRSTLEIVNDSNERIINWWRIVRDRPSEFGQLVNFTPHSRAEFNWARENLDNNDELYRALAFHIVVTQSAMHTDENAYWRTKRAVSSNSLCLWSSSKVEMLAERIREVQLECRDALEILDKVKDYKDTIIYCDPPYPSADISHYGENQVDYDALGSMIKTSSAMIAISGYSDEWDSLGWEKHRHDVTTHQIGGEHKKRTEILWTNFSRTAAGRPRLF